MVFLKRKTSSKVREQNLSHKIATRISRMITKSPEEFSRHPLVINVKEKRPEEFKQIDQIKDNFNSLQITTDQAEEYFAL